MVQEDPYRAPQEVAQPRGIGVLAIVGITILTGISVVAAFFGTCFPLGMATMQLSASLDLALLVLPVSGGIAVYVGIRVARALIRHQRAEIKRSFENEHGG